MEAEELRVLNWLTVPRKKDDEFYDKPVRVGAIGKGTFGVIEDGKRLVAIKDDLSPITLTEAILVKSGFKREEGFDDPYYIMGDLFLAESITGYYELYLIHRSCISGTWDFDDLDELEIKLREVRYVHQLQNLYFALTGDELNIEL